MSNIILLHGSWHRGIHYATLKHDLEHLGYHVLAPDLPGHHENASAIELKRITLNDYCKALCSWLKSLSQPSILIAHSLAGLIATQALELCAANIKQIIYISAFVPQQGESVASLLKKNKGSVLPLVSEPCHEGACSILIPDKYELFYQGLDQQTIAKTASQLVAEPNKPLKEALFLTHEDALRVPRDYIVCTQDTIIMPQLQYAMSDSASGIRHQVTLKCGHFPFFEKEQELLKTIVGLIDG